MPAERIEIGHNDADEADHRADREVDPAAQNDEGRADRGGDDKGVVGQDVAEDLGREEIVVEKPARHEQGEEDGDRRDEGQIFLVHRLLPPRPLESAARRLSDCKSRTTMTTTALTTRLYSGGSPLVRIEVVSVWMTSAPRIVMPR